MIAHKDEIYSRPKRTWIVTEKEKRMVVKAAKVNSYAPYLFCVNMHLFRHIQLLGVDLVHVLFSRLQLPLYLFFFQIQVRNTFVVYILSISLIALG